MALVYPLEVVIGIKERRVDEAKKEVARKQAELDREKEILAQREAARDQVLNHMRDKLAQIRETMDRECHTNEIQQMRLYLNVVKAKLEEEEKRVAEQKKQVDIAQKNLDFAKKELAARQKEVDKIKEHKAEWTKAAKKEEADEEARKQDEMGSDIFLSRLQQKRG